MILSRKPNFNKRKEMFASRPHINKEVVKHVRHELFVRKISHYIFFIFFIPVEDVFFFSMEACHKHCSPLYSKLGLL